MAQWSEHSPPTNVAWGLIPRLGFTCELRSLVLYSTPKGFSPGTLVFPGSPQMFDFS